MTHDRFMNQLHEARRRVREMQAQAGQDPSSRGALLSVAFQELETTLEELRVAEEELRVQNEQLGAAHGELERWRVYYQDLFEFAPDAYLVTDGDGVIQEANVAASKLFQIGTRFLRGKPLVNFVAAEDRSDFRSAVSRIEGQAGLQEWEVRLHPRDRASFYASLTVTPFPERHDSPVFLRWLIRDTSARKAAEDARLRRQAEETHEAEKQRLCVFLRDMLASVTEGKLRLCFTPEELPPCLTPVGGTTRLTRDSGSRELRHRVDQSAQQCGIPAGRWQDLETAVGECAMNAAMHGGGGEARIYVSDAGTVQVRIVDHGTGIQIESLPRATLERGYTTAGTFGHGFKMMIQTVDRVWLLTGPTGTTVVLEQNRIPPEPTWLMP